MADILNQLVKSDPEIVVCNSLDEVVKVSIKHMLLTKIFYNLKPEFLKHAKPFSDTPDGIKPLDLDMVLV